MIKYPRTSHLPFSLGMTSDDKMLQSDSFLIGKEVIVTEKMDGENTSMYSNGFHARSLDSRHHSSRDWLAAFHASICNDIPEEWRICGENVFAKHSISYEGLPSYFLGFSMWNSENDCLSWDDTLMYFELVGVTPVKELYRGVYSESLLKELVSKLDVTTQEGFVVRPVSSFKFEDFNKAVAKFVRKGHVQTDSHWMHSIIISNKLLTIA
jgi:hypothetical protein